MTLATRNHAQITQASISDTREQLQMLEKFVDEVLIIDRDFGVIPGTSGKPTLFKPGAHNIMTAMQCYSRPQVVDRQIDHVTGFFYVECMTEIILRSTGDVVAVGYGSCNSYERKYRYRNQERTCIHCGKETIIKGKAEYGGGWLCWAKKGGCGAKYDDDDSAIVAQVVGQIENTDLLDQANTYLKMAEKRSDVDAAMKLPGVARKFTQDIGDYADPEGDDTAIGEEPAQQPQAPPKARQRSSGGGTKAATAKLGNCETHPGKVWTHGSGDEKDRIGHPKGPGQPWHWKDEETETEAPPPTKPDTPVIDRFNLEVKAPDFGMTVKDLQDQALEKFGNSDLDALTSEQAQELMDWMEEGGDSPDATRR